MNSNDLLSEFSSIIDMTGNYFIDSNCWNVGLYTEKIKCFSINMMTVDLNTASCDINEGFKSDLLHLQAEQCPDIKRVCRIVEMACHYYALSNNNEIYSETYTEQGTELRDNVQLFFFDEESKNIRDYYKNLLDAKDADEFVQILEFLQSEIQKFDINLVYCEKIIAFINNEFKEKGVYPNHLIFFEQFLANATDSMILTISKLFLDSCDIGKKKNCGICYLQSFLNKKLSHTAKQSLPLQPTLREVSTLIKKVKSKSIQIGELRKSLIAHKDINNAEKVLKIRLQLDDFISIFDLSVRILELLSLKYFERKSIFNSEYIKTHGYKVALCQNIWMHNSNPYGKTDLDLFFDLVRSYFINS